MPYFRVIRVFRGCSVFLLYLYFNDLRLKLARMGLQPRRLCFVHGNR